MASGIDFDRRRIERLGIGDQTILKVLKEDNIWTIADLQRRLVRDGKIYGVGAKRMMYLRQKLQEAGLIAVRPWTDRFHERVFGASRRIYTLSVEGEKMLANQLTEWLHNEAEIPHSDLRADPLFVFCARVGCGRIQRQKPGDFDGYQVYELRPNVDGRYDDVVLGSGKIAQICGVDVAEVNLIYQRCLRFLRGRKVAAEVKRIFREYGERRK